MILTKVADLRERAAVLLADGHSVSEASALINIRRETLSRWLNHSDDFKKLVWLNRLANLNSQISALCELVPAAVRALEAALEDPRSQVRAAKTILQIAKSVRADTVKSALEKLDLSKIEEEFPALVPRSELDEAEREEIDRAMSVAGLSLDYVVTKKKPGRNV